MANVKIGPMKPKSQAQINAERLYIGRNYQKNTTDKRGSFPNLLCEIP